MVTGPAVADAIEKVVGPSSNLGVGTHLDLTEGRPLTGRGGGNPLIAMSGELKSSFGWLLANARRPKVRAAIETELRAQVERSLELLPNVDHLNSHEHVHAIPQIFEVVCELAAEYGIPFVRRSRERPHGTAGRSLTGLLKLGTLAALDRRAGGSLAASEVSLNDWLVGVSNTGRMTVETALSGLDALRGGGIAEVLMHPALVLADRQERYPSARGRDYALKPERVWELKALTDPALAGGLASRGWQPTCYACLAGTARHDHSPAVRTGSDVVGPSPPLRTLAVIDDDPLYHPRYVRRLLEECPDLEFVGAAVVRPEGGTGPERYMRSQVKRLRPGELALLGARRLAAELGRRSVAGEFARAGITPRVVSSVNDGEFLAYARGLEPDVILSSNSLIFKEQLLDLPRIGCINRHSALLPSYGGVMPVFRAVQNGERFTGVSVHEMVPEIDRGRVLARRWLPIFPGDTLERLYESCFNLSFEATAEAARLLRHGEEPVRDDTENLEASYYSWPDEDDWREFRRRGGRLI
jgi:methionyl-tRNA formyltransferase